MAKQKADKAPRGLTHRVFELAPGFFVSGYFSPRDGAFVIEIEGNPRDDEDCKNVRVYMNDGMASKWIGVTDPGYGMPDHAAVCTRCNGTRFVACGVLCGGCVVSENPS